jgi:hypothetical protein
LGKGIFFSGGAIQGRREQGEEEPEREMCEKERKKKAKGENENVANFFFFQKHG